MNLHNGFTKHWHHPRQFPHLNPIPAPQARAGAKSDSDIFMEFMNLWDTQVKEGIVSMEEFCAYHEDISALVPTDEAFDVYMKTVFK